MTGLDRAIEAAGSATALAARLGLTQSAVSNWKLRGRVPPEWCLKIETALGAAVTRYELRPDVFGDGTDAATATDQQQAA